MSSVQYVYGLMDWKGAEYSVLRHEVLYLQGICTVPACPINKLRGLQGTGDIGRDKVRTSVYLKIPLRTFHSVQPMYIPYHPLSLSLQINSEKQ